MPSRSVSLLLVLVGLTGLAGCPRRLLGRGSPSASEALTDTSTTPGSAADPEPASEPGGRVDPEDLDILIDDRAPMVVIALSPPRLRRDGAALVWSGVNHRGGHRYFVVKEYCGEGQGIEVMQMVQDRTEYTYEAPLSGCDYSIFVRDASLGDGPESGRIDMP